MSNGQQRMILKAFTQHPASVGETYGQHLRQASGFGGRLIIAGLACLLHGVFPFLFVKTGSRQIVHLHDKMVTNRSKIPEMLDFVI